MTTINGDFVLWNREVEGVKIVSLEEIASQDESTVTLAGGQILNKDTIHAWDTQINTNIDMGNSGGPPYNYYYPNLDIITV